MTNRRWLLALFLSITCPAVWAQLPAGGEFQVNSYTTGYQRFPSVASDATGNFVVVWEGQDGNGSGIVGQRFNTAGLAQGSEFPVNSYTTGWQFFPAVASDANGNFVVVWESRYQDGSENGIFGQRFAASGLPRGREFQINSYTTSSQSYPAVASDANGNFVVVWHSPLPDAGGIGWSLDIFGQRFDASGLPQGGEFQINSYTTGTQYGPAVASDPSGNFVVVWDSYGQDGSGWGIFGQLFNVSGLPRGGEFQINSYTTGTQDWPAVASDPSGNFMVVWESVGQDGSGRGTFGQRFNAGGVPQGAEFQINSYTTGTQCRPAVTSDPSGNFMIVWSGYAQGGDHYDVFAQRFTAAGLPQGSEFQVNSYTTGYQGNAAVASDANGNFVVAWQSDRQDGHMSGIFGQRFSGSGVPQGAEFQVNSYTTSFQSSPAVASAANGNFVVVWQSQGYFSQGQDGSYSGIFGQRFGDLIFRDGFQ